MSRCLWYYHGHPEVCETCGCEKVEPLPEPPNLCRFGSCRQLATHGEWCHWHAYVKRKTGEFVR